MILRRIESKVSVISRRMTTLCKTKIILDSTKWIIVLLHIVAKNLDHRLHQFQVCDFPSLFSIIFAIGYYFNSSLTVLITSMDFCGFPATH